MKKKTKKMLVLALVACLALTGCTKQMVDSDKKAVTNPETGQTLTSNIICRPSDKELLELYSKNEEYMTVKLEDLKPCKEMKIYEKNDYDGLWVALFVRPLAWLIIKAENLLGYFGLSVMAIGLLIRLLLLPVSAKTAKQSQMMQKIQPELQKIEKKYAGKDDQESMMKKSQETMMVYKKYNINPLSSCLVTFIQLPLFLAFLEAINRVPAIFEETFGPFQLGTTPAYGITHGNYWYLILIILIVGFTALTFMLSMGSMTMGGEEQAKQQKFMMLFMVVFIGIASVQLPAAIGLYWIVTNAFGVVQTLIIKKNNKESSKSNDVVVEKKINLKEEADNEVKDAEFVEKKPSTKKKSTTKSTSKGKKSKK